MTEGSDVPTFTGWSERKGEVEDYTVTVVCPTIVVSSTAPSAGIVGVPYSWTFSQTAANGTMVWSVGPGSLPAGLGLDPQTGIVTGSPTTPGTSNFTIRVTDQSGCVGTRDVSILINRQTDYGDYNGFPSASQSVHSAIRIGVNPTDLDVTSHANGTASGDDTNGTDDEDLELPDFYVGATTPLTIPIEITPSQLLGGVARVRVFIDWNGDGDADDEGETLPTQSVLLGGPKVFMVLPPVGTLPGTKYLRVRITDGSSLPVFNGASINKGEVEDYPVTLRESLAIGNLVWNDLNNNGIKDPAEPGVGGATVQLFTTGADNAIGGTGEDEDIQVGTDFVTTASGLYQFGQLIPGKYFVKVTPPSLFPLTSGTPVLVDNGVNNDNNGISLEAWVNLSSVLSWTWQLAKSPPMMVMQTPAPKCRSTSVCSRASPLVILSGTT
jgi:hypothetical protein